ncbi:protein kinase, partial [bacterium]|nr:protein kinase [bacterium]
MVSNSGMDPNNSEQLRLCLSDDHRRRVEEFRQRHRTGVLSLVFTDMVGSTGLKQRLGDAAGTALIEEQQHLVRAVLGEFREAEEISTAGDSFFVVFIRPSDAVRFALRLLARLRARGDQPAPILVRVGLHMGEVFIQAGQDESWRDILGIQVDTASRVMSLAAGGQILLTRAVFDNARAVLRGEELAGVGPLTWLDHGPYEIKGVEEPLSICEVGETGHAPLSPPADSAKAHRCCTPDQEPVLGWRPSLDQVVPGTQWVLDEKLGEGGFGEVWRAYHKSLRRHRVFKFCFKPDRVRSLKREVTLFRLLAERSGDHPHIVRLFDVYFDEPPFYIVMEYVPGKDLVEWCRARGGAAEAPLAARLEIVAQMADALQTAHEAGIIHRDIKPANILLEKDGGAGAPHAKLTDIGIGQVVSRGVLEGRTGEGFTETLVATSHSSRSGTQIYMAPEVLAGQISSTRSDIYSLGVVLYQLLIGDFKCPLTTDWEKHVPDPLLVEDLRRCFAGNPCERFSSAAELRDNLRSLEDRRRRREEAEAVARQMARRQRTLRILWPAVVAFLALAILASLGMERAHRLQRAAEAARAALEQEQARTAAALAAAQLARDQAHRALYDSSLLNEVLRSASSEVEPLLERFRVLLMEPIRR